jgi:hypothetical protein
MSKEMNKHEHVARQEDAPEQEDMLLGNSTRQDFIKQGAAGLAGLPGATVLGMQPSQVEAQETPSGKKRVTILFDSWNHMMLALAREMVRRNHDLVLGDARDEELVDRARDAFGGFDSACVQSGTHVNASVALLRP